MLFCKCLRSHPIALNDAQKKDGAIWCWSVEELYKPESRMNIRRTGHETASLFFMLSSLRIKPCLGPVTSPL